MSFFETNKEMGMFALIALAIVAIFFVYKDTKKTKDDFNVLSQKVSNLAMVNDVPRPPTTAVAQQPDNTVITAKNEE
tara:strand:- start:2496 stop:2726 length:231 start_codon:yes stop_codon:yes gene_type:complete